MYVSNVLPEVDPYQNLNEKTHNFNQSLDESIATPIARAYKKITPDFIEIGVTNFTDNIEDVNIALNNLLQGKIKDGLSDIARFTINSTVGIFGHFRCSFNYRFKKTF